MNDRDFEKMDADLMKKTQGLREKCVSDRLLRGFSASVERKILAGQETPSPRRRSWAPAWAPALAVMVLASVAVLRAPGEQTSATVASAIAQENEIDEDISMLQELGAWSESDGSTSGILDELDAQLLELVA